MNERMLELARQVWPDPNISHANHMKFAELIVRECLLSLEPDLYSKEIDYEFEQRFYRRCREKIVKHFGVEE